MSVWTDTLGRAESRWFVFFEVSFGKIITPFREQSLRVICFFLSRHFGSDWFGARETMFVESKPHLESLRFVAGLLLSFVGRVCRITRVMAPHFFCWFIYERVNTVYKYLSMGISCNLNVWNARSALAVLLRYPFSQVLRQNSPQLATVRLSNLIICIVYCSVISVKGI